MAEVGDEVGEYGYAILAMLPTELYAPIHLLRCLSLTTIEISPCDSVDVWRRRKIRTIDFEAGELLVLVAVNIEDRNRAGEFGGCG